jgi:hypothetical protein
LRFRRLCNRYAPVAIRLRAATEPITAPAITPPVILVEPAIGDPTAELLGPEMVAPGLAVELISVPFALTVVVARLPARPTTVNGSE